MTPGGAGPRPRRRWIWVLVALATAVVVVVPTTARALLKTELQHQYDPPFRYRRGVADLKVHAGVGGIVTISAGRPGRVTIVTTLAWLFRKPTVTRSWSGRTLTVSASCPSFDPFADCLAGLSITVPPGTAVQGLAGPGSLAVSGLSGPLHRRSGAARRAARRTRNARGRLGPRAQSPGWYRPGLGRLSARIRLAGGRHSTSRSCRVWSRRGPTPTAHTGAPIMSSTARTYACAFFGRSANSRAAEMSSGQPSRYS
jgi:hypothetical protein